MANGFRPLRNWDRGSLDERTNGPKTRRGNRRKNPEGHWRQLSELEGLKGPVPCRLPSRAGDKASGVSRAGRGEARRGVPAEPSWMSERFGYTPAIRWLPGDPHFPSRLVLRTGLGRDERGGAMRRLDRDGSPHQAIATESWLRDFVSSSCIKFAPMPRRPTVFVHLSLGQRPRISIGQTGFG